MNTSLHSYLIFRKFYCTVRLTVLEWGFVLLHRQAARGALTAGGSGYHLYLTAESTLPLSDGWNRWMYPHPFWRVGVPSPFLTAGCTTVPPFQNRQATRGAVTAWPLYGWQLQWQFVPDVCMNLTVCLVNKPFIKTYNYFILQFIFHYINILNQQY